MELYALGAFILVNMPKQGVISNAFIFTVRCMQMFICLGQIKHSEENAVLMSEYVMAKRCTVLKKMTDQSGLLLSA